MFGLPSVLTDGAAAGAPPQELRETLNLDVMCEALCESRLTRKDLPPCVKWPACPIGRTTFIESDPTAGAAKPGL